MGVLCSIDTIIDLKYSDENIKKVLSRGQLIGAKYYMGLSERVINIDKAVYTVMHNDSDAEEMFFLKIQVRETEINLYCYKCENNDKLMVDFFLASNIWKKNMGKINMRNLIQSATLISF